MSFPVSRDLLPKQGHGTQTPAARLPPTLGPSRPPEQCRNGGATKTSSGDAALRSSRQTILLPRRQNSAAPPGSPTRFLHRCFPSTEHATLYKKPGSVLQNHLVNSRTLSKLLFKLPAPYPQKPRVRWWVWPGLLPHTVLSQEKKSSPGLRR